MFLINRSIRNLCVGWMLPPKFYICPIFSSCLDVLNTLHSLFFYAMTVRFSFLCPVINFRWSHMSLKKIGWGLLPPTTLSFLLFYSNSNRFNPSIDSERKPSISYKSTISLLIFSIRDCWISIECESMSTSGYDFLR